MKNGLSRRASATSGVSTAWKVPLKSPEIGEFVGDLPPG